MAKSRKGKAKPPTTSEPPRSPDAQDSDLEMTEEEQWRIINETGVLNKLSQLDRKDPPAQEEDEEEGDFANEIFNMMLYLIPMSSILLIMDILVHWQYGRKPTFTALKDRMLPGMPILGLLIFYTNRFKQRRQMQFLLFVLSLVVGPRLIWLINLGSWKLVMKQAPPLAALWVHCVLHMNLGPAALSIVVIGIWTWWKGMKLVL